MIHIVLSKTIQCGKSTIASQIIAPHLFNKNKKIQLITQVCNKTSEYTSYTQSNIVKHEILNNNNWNEKIDKIFDRNEDLILDVNLEYNLKILNHLEKKINHSNLLFFIPITDKEIENKNLDYMLNLINKKFNNPNIILVFNRVNNKEDFKFQYFNIFGYKDLGIQGVKDIEKYKYLLINYDPIINISNKFSSLVSDFASNENVKRVEREETFYNDKLIEFGNKDEEKKLELFEKMDIVIAKKKLINKSILFMKKIEGLF